MKSFKTSKSHFILAVLGISLLIFPPVYGGTTEEHEIIHKSSVAPFNEPQFTKAGELTFFSKNNRKITTIDIEIPDTLEEKRRGLMYRHVMADTEGMVFVNDMSTIPFFLDEKYVYTA